MSDTKNKRSKRLFLVKFDATYVLKLILTLIALIVAFGIYIAM